MVQPGPGQQPGMMGGVNMNTGPQNQQQQQQQQQGFQQPPPVQHFGPRPRQPLPGMVGFPQQQQQHGGFAGADQFMNPNNSGQFGGQQPTMQQPLQQQQMKNTSPPTMSPSPQQQGMMVPPNVSPQQLMHV